MFDLQERSEYGEAIQGIAVNFSFSLLTCYAVVRKRRVAWKIKPASYCTLLKVSA